MGPRGQGIGVRRRLAFVRGIRPLMAADRLRLALIAPEPALATGLSFAHGCSG
jgi:hypothetical protein